MSKLLPLPFGLSDRIEAFLVKRVKQIPYVQFRFSFSTPTAAVRSWIRPEVWCERDPVLEFKYPNCRIYNAGFDAFGVELAAGICMPKRSPDQSTDVR